MTGRTVAGGRYVLSDPPLGVGGMGTVWKAYDSVLRRDVAVKEVRIPDGLRPDERAAHRARVMREARAAAGLDHPAIVTIHDVVDEPGGTWIVMHLLAGRALDATVRADGPLSPRETARLGLRLLDALVTAHDGGVLHRDVKPQNVMRDGGGRWMLTDFGIASVAGATRTLTATGLVSGTLGYVAPERLSGAAHGASADLWSLGATLYFAVEGRPAYDHDDLPAMIAAVLTRDPEPAERAGPLRPVIEGLLRRDPELRTAAEAAREQLLAVAEGRGAPRRDADRGGITTTDPARTDHAETELIGAPQADATKVLPTREPGVPAGPAAFPDGADQTARLRRTTTWLLVVLNLGLGSLAGLMIYSVTDGMPLWILGALGVSLALGWAAGGWLQPLLTRWFGLPLALVAAALLTGEALVGAGVWGAADNIVPGIAVSFVGFVFFAAWHRAAGIGRRAGLPTATLPRDTTAYRAWGTTALVVGVGAGYGLVASGLYEEPPFDGAYPNGLLATAGTVVVLGTLMITPDMRGLSDVGRGARLSRTARVRRRLGFVVAVLALPAAVLPPLVAAAVDRQDDFTQAPDVCTLAALSQARVAEVIPGPPEPEASSGSDYMHCYWTATVAGGGAVELYASTEVLDSSADMSRIIDDMLGDGGTAVAVGDKAALVTEDWYSIDSVDAPTLSLVVQIDNLELEVRIARTDGLRERDTATITALAREATREIVGLRPAR